GYPADGTPGILPAPVRVLGQRIEDRRAGRPGELVGDVDDQQGRAVSEHGASAVARRREHGPVAFTQVPVPAPAIVRRRRAAVFAAAAHARAASSCLPSLGTRKSTARMSIT